MKTLIEICDDEQVLNLLSAYHEKPEKTVILYEEGQEKVNENKVIRRYCGNVSFVRYDMDSLEDQLKKYCGEDSAVDISGGNDLAIAAASMFAVHAGIPLCCPDLKEHKMMRLVKGKYLEEALHVPHLSVKEVIELYGGKVRELEEIQYDDAGRRAVETVNRVKRANDSRWSAFTKVMGGLYKKYGKNSQWRADDSVYNEYRTLLRGMKDDVFSLLEVRDGRLYIEFKSPDYMILLADAGVPFEYDTYYQMQDSGFFDDLDIRVNIDWNGGSFEHNDPNSELDVMATKDGRLISVSCKAGKYDQQAIYEVKANAEKFGGRMAVCVLCVDHHVDHPEYVLKAEELEVLLIEHKDMWDGRCADRIAEWLENH